MPDGGGELLYSLAELAEPPVEAAHLPLTGYLEAAQGSEQGLLEGCLGRAHDPLLGALEKVLAGGDGLPDGPCHRLAGCPDQLQELLRGRGMAAPLPLQDDLGEGDRGQVAPGGAVDDLDVFPVMQQFTDALQRYVLARGGVVELAIGVLLDQPCGARGLRGVDRGRPTRPAAARGRGAQFPLRS